MSCDEESSESHADSFLLCSSLTTSISSSKKWIDNEYKAFSHTKRPETTENKGAKRTLRPAQKKQGGRGVDTLHDEIDVLCERWRRER